jgi:hypothetical protein
MPLRFAVEDPFRETALAYRVLRGTAWRIPSPHSLLETGSLVLEQGGYCGFVPERSTRY